MSRKNAKPMRSRGQATFSGQATGLSDYRTCRTERGICGLPRRALHRRLLRAERLEARAVTQSEASKAKEQHLRALARVEQAASEAAQGGGDAARVRHLARSKMLPRDRVANLLDPGSAFLEIGATAAHGMYDGAAPCAGRVAGGCGRRGSWGLCKRHQRLTATNAVILMGNPC